MLQHDSAWDKAIGQAVQMANDERISQYLFKRNGVGIPGHLRISEAKEMADELCTYIKSLGLTVIRN